MQTGCLQMCLSFVPTRKREGFGYQCLVRSVHYFNRLRVAEIFGRLKGVASKKVWEALLQFTKVRYFCRKSLEHQKKRSQN